ncbi:MAG TPA: hypothetical protein VK009_05080 [Chloroflexota bacterium]|nr:hypothetical protein [Chloroflexota bacterium]
MHAVYEFGAESVLQFGATYREGGQASIRLPGPVNEGKFVHPNDLFDQGAGANDVRLLRVVVAVFLVANRTDPRWSWPARDLIPVAMGMVAFGGIQAAQGTDSRRYYKTRREAESFMTKDDGASDFVGVSSPRHSATIRKPLPDLTSVFVKLTVSLVLKF